MRAVRRMWRSLRPSPAVGGVVALVGWPGANGPTHLVPGTRPGRWRHWSTGVRWHGRRGTRVRRCGRRGRRGPAGRTADHLAADDHHPGPLDPVDDRIGPVVSTLLP